MSSYKQPIPFFASLEICYIKDQLFTEMGTQRPQRPIISLLPPTAKVVQGVEVTSITRIKFFPKAGPGIKAVSNAINVTAY